MTNELPKLKVGRKTYYLDARLSQLRNVRNPHDFEDLGEVDLAFAILALSPEEAKKLPC